jgi:hypothetical protein
MTMSSIYNFKLGKQSRQSVSPKTSKKKTLPLPMDSRTLDKMRSEYKKKVFDRERELEAAVRIFPPVKTKTAVLSVR